ncbi:MAG: hypothetical protein NTU44_11335, partial [Bacteroidetes bacterium]|nr:hypothetical protein [Bacteroidota bacterium]
MKKSTLFLALIFCIGLTFNLQQASAAYLRNIPVTLTQPNGLVIHCFASGDEFHNWLHDANNFTIMRNPHTGWLVYAILVNGEIEPSGYIVGQSDPMSAGLTPGANISAERWKQLRANRQKTMKRPDLRKIVHGNADLVNTINNLI